nr:MAG: hypothetical protein [Microviridae sp.]
MQTQENYNYKTESPELNSGEIITERGGYVPHNVRIEEIIAAGERLYMSRAEQFDQYGDFTEDLVFDPTRSPNFDMADASILLEDLKYKQLKAKEAKHKLDEAEKASKMDSEAVLKASEPQKS